MLVYLCLHGLAPAYLSSELQSVKDLPSEIIWKTWRRPACPALRSSLLHFQVVLTSRLSTVGCRAFPVEQHALVLETCKTKVKMKLDLYSAPLWEARHWSAQVWITQLLLPTRRTRLYLVAFTRWRHQCSDSSHLILAYYSFIDTRTRRMKGWVGLISWPTADGLPI